MLFQIIKPHRHNKGEHYLRILNSIEKIKNFSQIEPTRQLIDLFGNKTGDLELKQELLEKFFEKAKNYQPLYEENISHSQLTPLWV